MAAGALAHYLRETQKADLAHVRAVVYRTTAESLVIDPVTLRHLEVVTGSEGGVQGSLLHEIDRTATAMGGRLLRAWLLRPLLALEPIRDRLDAVEELAFRTPERGPAPRGADRRARPRAAGGARVARHRRPARSRRRCATPAPPFRASAPRSTASRRRCCAASSPASTTSPTCASASAPRSSTSRRRWPATAASPATASTRALDELRHDQPLRPAGRSPRWRTPSARAPASLAQGQVQPRVRLLHRDLEVEPAPRAAPTTSASRRLPAASASRRRRSRTTKSTCSAPTSGSWRASSRSSRRCARRWPPRRRASRTARASSPRSTCWPASPRRPRSATTPSRTCTTATSSWPPTSRHPVVERRTSDAFVPNDVDLNGTTRQVVILTGPNMGGKSTYLRQTALLPLLAQIGSFVPARDAKLPLVDRIFARVGASDNIARGHSTFMVEMQETANILHTATSRSLVVLDEIGRGTSTFDGLSIAWAVAEYLASPTRHGAAEDALRHALSRADRPGRRAARRRQRARGGARVEGRHHLPAQDRPRPRRPQLRHPGGAAGRPAAGGDRPRQGDPHRPRARRAVARRAADALAERPPRASRQLALFAGGETAADPRLREIVARLRALDLDDTTPRQALDALAELRRLAEDA